MDHQFKFALIKLKLLIHAFHMFRQAIKNGANILDILT